MLLERFLCSDSHWLEILVDFVNICNYIYSEYYFIMENAIKKIIFDFKKDEVFITSIAEKIAGLLANATPSLETKILQNILVENEELKRNIDNMEQNIDDMEQKLKLDQLRIYGIGEDKNANLKQFVEETFSSKLGIKFNLLECYRSGKLNVFANQPRAVKVRFENTNQRNIVFLNKRKLKESNIVVVEELTKNKYTLMLAAKEKFGQRKVWSTGGNIYTMVDGSIVQLNIKNLFK